MKKIISYLVEQRENKEELPKIVSQMGVVHSAHSPIETTELKRRIVPLLDAVDQLEAIFKDRLDELDKSLTELRKENLGEKDVKKFITEFLPCIGKGSSPFLQEILKNPWPLWEERKPFLIQKYKAVKQNNSQMLYTLRLITTPLNKFRICLNQEKTMSDHIIKFILNATILPLVKEFLVVKENYVQSRAEGLKKYLKEKETHLYASTISRNDFNKLLRAPSSSNKSTENKSTENPPCTLDPKDLRQLMKRSNRIKHLFDGRESPALKKGMESTNTTHTGFMFIIKPIFELFDISQFERKFQDILKKDFSLLELLEDDVTEGGIDKNADSYPYFMLREYNRSKFDTEIEAKKKKNWEKLCQYNKEYLGNKTKLADEKIQVARITEAETAAKLKSEKDEDDDEWLNPCLLDRKEPKRKKCKKKKRTKKKRGSKKRHKSQKKTPGKQEEKSNNKSKLPNTTPSTYETRQNSVSKPSNSLSPSSNEPCVSPNAVKENLSISISVEKKVKHQSKDSGVESGAEEAKGGGGRETDQKYQEHKLNPSTSPKLENKKSGDLVKKTGVAYILEKISDKKRIRWTKFETTLKNSKSIPINIRGSHQTWRISNSTKVFIRPHGNSSVFIEKNQLNAIRKILLRISTIL